MTKQEKIGLLFIPVMFLLLAIDWRYDSGSWIKTGSDLYLAILFPVFIYCMYFWLYRGINGRWIEFVGEDAILSHKPIALRTLYGLLTVCLGSVAGYMFILSLSTSSSDHALPLLVTGAIFGGTALLFLFGAGPQDVRFDLRRGEWRRTLGFPLITWTKRGSTDGAELILSFSGTKGTYFYNLQFKPAKGYAITIGMYGQRETARADTSRISDLLHIPVTNRRQ